MVATAASPFVFLSNFLKLDPYKSTSVNHKRTQGRTRLLQG